MDKVVVSGVQGYFAMDDFTYHRDAANAVPEPASLGLAFLALATAGFAGKRRR